MTGQRTKSANVVGQTMRLNPHGDAAIYETLVRLTRGNESLLHPFIDSKGSFGKQYSRDMAYAASRYTEVKLDPFCAELFRGIDKNAVDFCDNYDATMKEPGAAATTFPNLLISPESRYRGRNDYEYMLVQLSRDLRRHDTAAAPPRHSGRQAARYNQSPRFPGRRVSDLRPSQAENHLRNRNAAASLCVRGTHMKKRTTASTSRRYRIPLR